MFLEADRTSVAVVGHWRRIFQQVKGCLQRHSVLRGALTKRRADVNNLFHVGFVDFGCLCEARRVTAAIVVGHFHRRRKLHDANLQETPVISNEVPISEICRYWRWAQIVVHNHALF